ncbi:MAG: ThiF family adenylyltransferase [Fusobacteriaceae bacterium]
MKDRIINYLKSKKYEIEESLEGIITIHQLKNKTIKIKGELGKTFPFTLPTLYLLERDKYGLLGHIAWNKKNNLGSICTGVSVNRSIDYDNPENIYEKCLIEGLETLFNSINDEQYNKIEVMKEFNAHWAYAAQETIVNFVEPSTSLKYIRVFEKNNKIYSFEENNEINSKYSFFKSLQNKHRLIGKAIYLPIENKTLPPTPLEDINAWWKNLLINSPDLQKNLLDTIKSKNFDTLWIIASIKMYDKYSWFALKFIANKKIKINIVEDFSLFKITPLYVIPHNKEYILPRGGALNLEKKRVLIVGSGSVGGEIANNIASSGLVNEMTLVDFDNLEIENIYRHTLGGNSIGIKKVISLQKEIMSKYPYINIKYKIDSLTNLLDKDFLNSFDGIIVATGDCTIERFFNDEVFKMEKRPWIIYSWLEGYGIGGHTVYIHNTGKGCLSCLYRNVYDEKSLHSIQNFINAGQNTSVDISGCGSHFLPYSFLDAKETALLSSRIVLKALLGEFNESKRISWKGKISLDINLKTTYRYNEIKETCLNLTSLYWDKCEVCNV